MEALAQRLEKVERQNRRLKMVAAVVLALAVAGLVMGQALPRARIVEAEGFVLKDGAGKARAGLVMYNDGPMLALYDETGNFRAGLDVDKGVSGLRLADETGRPRVALTVLKDGSRLVLRDENGKVMWSAP
jgi:hypothetical protein